MSDEEVAAYLNAMRDPQTWVSFDVETSGVSSEYALQPWSPSGHVTSYATAKWRSSKSISAETKTDLEFGALYAACAECKPVVAWNSAFDCAWLMRHGHTELAKRIRWLDGMTIWRHLVRYPESDTDRAKRKRYGLKAAVEEFAPKYAGYEEGIDFSSMDPEAVAARLQYNKLDAQLTLYIATKLFKKLLAEKPWAYKAMLMECKAIPHVAEHYIHGLDVDVEHGKRLQLSLDAQVDALAAELEAEGAPVTVLNSPVQLRKLLFDDWGLPVVRETPKGEPSTDKFAMFDLAPLDERVAKMQRYRELKGLRTKFVDKVLESCAYTGLAKTHPTANIGATYTGRMTFASSILKGKDKRQTGFAIHQTKRAAEYRNLIKAPEGYTIVEWDAAGQEYRWMAIESGDETMLSLCEQGEDPHGYMGSQMSTYSYRELTKLVASGDKDAKRVRQSGKVGNLSCQYRIGVAKLLTTARVQHGMPWDEATAQEVYNTYHRTYPKVKKYWNRQVGLAKRQGYISTLAGRTIDLTGNWSGPQAWMMESAAINFPIQGVGADQKYLAMAALGNLFAKYNGRFFFELHDGLYAVFPDKYAKKAAFAGQAILNALPYKKAWGYTPPIPLPWDIKIGKRWGDSVELF